MDLHALDDKILDGLVEGADGKICRENREW